MENKPAEYGRAYKERIFSHPFICTVVIICGILVLWVGFNCLFTYYSTEKAEVIAEIIHVSKKTEGEETTFDYRIKYMYNDRVYIVSSDDTMALISGALGDKLNIVIDSENPRRVLMKPGNIIIFLLIGLMLLLPFIYIGITMLFNYIINSKRSRN